MSSKKPFAVKKQTSGLVIVFPSGLKSLFNPHIHRVVRDVEEQLDGVFVTYAVHGGASPDVDSAVSAVRFAGCSSAVVINADEWLDKGVRIDGTSDTLWFESCDSMDLHERVQRVVDVYNSALSNSGLAA